MGYTKCISNGNKKKAVEAAAAAAAVGATVGVSNLA